MQTKQHNKKRKLILFLSCFTACFLAVAGTATIFAPHLMKNMFSKSVIQLDSSSSEQNINLVCDNVQPNTDGFLSTLNDFEQCHADNTDTLALVKSSSPKVNQQKNTADNKEPDITSVGTVKDGSENGLSTSKNAFADQLSKQTNTESMRSNAKNLRATRSSSPTIRHATFGDISLSRNLQSFKSQSQLASIGNEPSLETNRNEPKVEIAYAVPNIDNSEPTTDDSNIKSNSNPNDNELSGSESNNELNVNVPIVQFDNPEPVVNFNNNESTELVAIKGSEIKQTDTHSNQLVVGIQPDDSLNNNVPTQEFSGNQLVDNVLTGSSNQMDGTLIHLPLGIPQIEEQLKSYSSVSNINSSGENIIKTGEVDRQDNNLFSLARSFNSAGNSPSLLTFDADLIVDGTNTNLTPLNVGISGSELRGIDYDAIDITGNLQFSSELNIITSLTPSLSVIDLFGKEFDILHVDGNILDALDNIVGLDNIGDLSINIDKDWGFKWIERVSGWGLTIFTNQSQANTVSEPKTVFLISFFLMLFGIKKYRRFSDLTKIN